MSSNLILLDALANAGGAIGAGLAAIGAGLGIGLIIFLWAAADIILGIVWLITNRKSRSCPTCGKDVKKGLTACKSCGYDFAISTNHLKA